MDDLAVWQYAVVAFAVGAGAVVQGSIGFGAALTAASVVSLVQPEAVPGTLLLLAFPLNVYVAARERGAIDTTGVGHLSVGLAVGTVVGVLVLRAAPRDTLEIAFGAAIVAAVVISVVHPNLRPSRGSRIAGGSLSGLITTVASTGGPAIALLYQRRPAPEVRATLAVAFFVSTVLSTVGLVFADRLGWLQVRLALLALPGLVAGLAVSGAVVRRLDTRALRPAVLLFSAGAGLAGIVRGVV